ncbi:hypothetical protein AAEX63_01850 [Luteococcus sp. H138]|uniref:hypothetical protein n=1 Tax=Luteococcus sp. H138 TaxID=3139404 RepID=UPI00313AA88E
MTELNDLWDAEPSGTFENPLVYPRNAAELVKFWATVEVPDSAARALVKAQQGEAESYAQVMARRAGYEYEEQCKAKRVKVDEPTIRQIRMDAYHEAKQTIPQYRPGYPVPVIRACMIHWYAEQYLEGEEREKAQTIPVRLPDLDQPTRPVDLWHYFKFENTLDDVMDAPENERKEERERLERIEQAVNELRQALIAQS